MAFVAIYRSAHPQAEQEAHEILNTLRESAVGTARVRQEDEPGGGIKAYVVEVDDSESYDAQAVLQKAGFTFEGLDAGGALDYHVAFYSETHDADSEALAVKSLLEANGITAFLAESSPLPNFPHKVLVPRAEAARANEVIESAKATGPMDAEAGSRQSGGIAGSESTE